MTNQKKEARRSARYATTTEIWWSLAGDEWEVCETGDLSEVGCFVLSTRQPPLQLPLQLSIQVGEGKWLRLTAKVVYELEVGFGVEFAYQDESEREAIADFIRAQRAAFGDVTA